MTDNKQQSDSLFEGLRIDDEVRPAFAADLRDRMLATFEQAESQEPPLRVVRLGSWLWRPIMNRSLRQIAVAATILIAVFAGFGWWSSSRGVAFADVVRAVQALQGARFTITTTGSAVGAGTIRFALLGDRMRQEMPDGSVCIIDFTEGTVLILMPENRQALLIHSEGLPEEMRQGARNWLAELRQNLVAGAAGAQDLGSRQLAGKPAWGFKITASDQTNEVWVDRQTNLPLRVEMTRHVPGTTIVMSDFDFATPVDESAVSLTPPQGYFVLQTTVDASNAGEKDAIELLQAYAEANGDRFPETLDLSSGRIGKVMESLGPRKGWGWSMSMAGTITRAMTFLHMVEDTRYIGSGVKLGDASQPVFYYQAKGSSMYRVIYGDLSVRDMSRDKLPISAAAN